MSLLLDLFLSFFKLGLFSFGGGYAMLPLIQSEIEQHGWLTSAQFADIVAIAEMTPGPIAVNTATYVGYSTGGLAGALIASAGVTLPSLLLVLLVARVYARYQKHPLNISIFSGLRPVVVGLILSAAWFIGQDSLIHIPDEMAAAAWFGMLMKQPLAVISPISLLIFALTIVLEEKTRIHPLLLIAGSGLIGLVLFSIFPG
jgi:chromate transporter